MKRIRILWRHLHREINVKNDFTDVSKKILQDDKFTQASFDVEVIDKIIAASEKHGVIRTALNSGRQAPVKFVVRRFEKLITIEVPMLENLIDNYVELHFNVTK